MTDWLFAIFSRIHRFSYKVLSFLAIRQGGGLHPKHAILKYHRFFLEHIPSDGRVLDIGCGNGALAYDLAKKARAVVAIDINEKNIAKAKEKYPRENLTHLVGNAAAYDFDGTFDAIVLSNVLEHIEKRKEFLEKIKLLAPEILIRVPLLTRDWLSVYLKEKNLEYRLDPTHFIEYTEESFREEMEVAELEIADYYVKFGEIYAVVVRKKS